MKRLLILYATQTGNTQEVATELYKKLSALFPEITFSLKNITAVSVKDIIAIGQVILGASTWDENLNPDADYFFSFVAKGNTNFSSCRFALFGLGDRVFADFCGAMPAIAQALTNRKATVYSPVFTMDGMPDDKKNSDLAAWAKEFLESLK